MNFFWAEMLPVLLLDELFTKKQMPVPVEILIAKEGTGFKEMLYFSNDPS